MTIMGALLRSGQNLNDPSTKLSSENFALFADGMPTTAGVPVTEKTLYGRTAWFRGVRIIAGTIAAMPLHTYRRGTRQRVSGWVLDEPCPNAATPFEFWQTMVANAITWGTGYAIKSRNPMGAVNYLTPIHPSAVTLHLITPDEDNPSGKWWEIRFPDELDPLVVTPREMFELPYMSLDGRTGITPMTVLPFQPPGSRSRVARCSMTRNHGKSVKVTNWVIWDSIPVPHDVDLSRSANVAVLTEDGTYVPLSAAGVDAAEPLIPPTTQGGSDVNDS